MRFFKSLLLCGVLLAVAGSTWAARCATGRNHRDGARPLVTRPVPRTQLGAAYRVVAPVPTTANIHTTKHFRVLWGNEFDPGDDDWQTEDGLPRWVRTLADALEHAYEVQTGLGFPEPYGVETYYLDAYVGNTGVVADGKEITIGSSFYAYTEIDRDPGLAAPVAYFVFNDDFSAYASDELSVLRATAAHELFHAVQRAMGYPWDAEGPWVGDEYIDDDRWEEEGWWLEASATWLEEVTVPEVDDYVTYVRDFLAEPDQALNSMDGLHEYGAAVFAAYLWQQYGGADTIRGVFEDAYGTADGPETVESALRGQLRSHGAAELEDVVAGFWVHATDPSPAIWPDAEQFKTGSVPYLLSTPEAAAVTIWPGTTRRPGRFGASLLRLPATELPAWFGVEWLNPAAEWRVAVRTVGSAGLEVHAPGPATPFWAGTAGEEYAYVAVVNVSTATGAEPFAIELGGDGLIDETILWRGSDSGGTVPSASSVPQEALSSSDAGCFLQALRQ